MSRAYDTEDLLDQIQSIGERLEAGLISNSVARTLLLEKRAQIETKRLEMDVSRLGCPINPVVLRPKDRPASIRKAS